MRLPVLSSILSVFLLAATGFAQLAPQAPQASYEGQNVSAISLIANPHRDLAPLRALVTQNAGEPYSGSKIEATAAALKEAGKFPKVEVTVVPEIAGLRINFLLEPAYYLGIVEFPGAGKSFSYTRLLQVVNLPDEDPYDPSRLPLGEGALKAFLDKNGYFEATVHAEARIDDAHQLRERQLCDGNGETSAHWIRTDSRARLPGEDQTPALDPLPTRASYRRTSQVRQEL